MAKPQPAMEPARETPNGCRVKKQTTIGRASAVLALGALVLTSQVPSPGASAPGWCTTIPLPRADLPSLTSNVDTQTIHHPRDLPCRPLDVPTLRTTLHLAVADDEPSREHGLMKVPYVPAGQGMLFAFPGGDQKRLFWMKDTIAALDMVFVNGDGTVTTIAANVPATAPGTPDDQVARRDGTGRYVIELAAGEAARLGIVAGERLSIPPVAAR
jgi:uncharacterized protein